MIRGVDQPPGLRNPVIIGAGFAFSGLAGSLTMLPAIPVGGMDRQHVAALAFFIGGALAAGVLRVGWLARIGFGLALSVGASASIFVSVATQAMTGRETVLFLLLFCMSLFVIPYGVGAGVGLLPMLRSGAKVYSMGVLGICAGAAFAGLVFFLGMLTGFLNYYTFLTIMIPIPAAVGGAISAWALNSMHRK